MRTLAKAHECLLVTLAILASVMLGAIFVAIVYDVTLRELGFRPPVWTIAGSEYALLYGTTLAAPWLLRQKSHVFITTFTGMLPSTARLLLEKATYVIGIVVCLVIAYASLDVALHSTGLEIRSFEMPRWAVFVSMPIGFVLMAVEFARFLLGVDSMYRRDGVNEEGL